MFGTCHLCLQNAKLKRSHIIPRFIFLWYKRTFVSGLRRSDNVNLRVQDGPKDYLLCGPCERKLGVWETSFSAKVFNPLHVGQNSPHPIRYGPWALKFAVSVSWRVLTYHKKVQSISGLSADQESAVERALEAWRRFLLGLAPLPEKFQQHLLPLDVIEKHTLPRVSPFLNRYLLRTTHFDVIGWGESLITFTKMFRIVIFGFINVKKPGHWKGTKLDRNGSTLAGSVGYVVPQPVIEFMNNKAQETMFSQSQLSRRQRQKTRELFSKSNDAVRRSEVARAMAYDVTHSGSAAFFHDDESET
jgi:hypothetical protein